MNAIYLHERRILHVWEQLFGNMWYKIIIVKIRVYIESKTIKCKQVILIYFKYRCFLWLEIICQLITFFLSEHGHVILSATVKKIIFVLSDSLLKIPIKNIEICQVVPYRGTNYSNYFWCFVI